MWTGAKKPNEIKIRATIKVNSRWEDKKMPRLWVLSFLLRFFIPSRKIRLSFSFIYFQQFETKGFLRILISSPNRIKRIFVSPVKTIADSDSHIHNKWGWRVKKNWKANKTRHSKRSRRWDLYESNVLHFTLELWVVDSLRSAGHYHCGSTSIQLCVVSEVLLHASLTTLKDCCRVIGWTFQRGFLASTMRWEMWRKIVHIKSYYAAIFIDNNENEVGRQFFNHP